MYKTVVCPECNGHGFISYSSDYSIGCSTCKECRGFGILTVPMTNGDIIRQCNNEELSKIYCNLKEWTIYSGGKNNRLLDKDTPEDFLLWLNKEADRIDIETIFDFIKEEEYDKKYYAAADVEKE